METLARWAKKKGIALLGTGDFTHPTYFAELRSKLEPLGNGLFKLKKGDQDKVDLLFLQEIPIVAE